MSDYQIMTLRRPLYNRGVYYQPGDTVKLHRDQITRLDAEHYFEPLKIPKRKSKEETPNAS